MLDVFRFVRGGDAPTTRWAANQTSVIVQFSLKTMLGLVAALSLALALTRVNFLIGGGAMVLYVIVVAIVERDPVRKRSMVYGAIGGVLLFIIGAVFVASTRGEFPVTSYSTSRTTFTFTRKYAFPIGGFVGAVLGCIYADVHKARRLPNGDA